VGHDPVHVLRSNNIFIFVWLVRATAHVRLPQIGTSGAQGMDVKRSRVRGSRSKEAEVWFGGLAEASISTVLGLIALLVKYLQYMSTACDDCQVVEFNSWTGSRCKQRSMFDCVQLENGDSVNKNSQYCVLGAIFNACKQSY